MVRQCAWCLCLIDGAGERISPTPLPKLYEASHGICSVCGTLWMEQATAQDIHTIVDWDGKITREKGHYITHAIADRAGLPVTELLFQLQQEKKEAPHNPRSVRKGSRCYE